MATMRALTPEVRQWSMQRPTMICIEFQVILSYHVGESGADFVFNIHPAHTAWQTVSEEHLSVSQQVNHHVHTDALTGNRQLRLHAASGALTVDYSATVEVHAQRVAAYRLTEVSITELPPAVLCYLVPSRYCQSDRLLTFAYREFGSVPPGHARAQAICDWVNHHVTFTSNVSNSNTSAVDTLVGRVGVCRDFAHLMIALCRAVNIPARFATGTDYGADVALGPPDFHAYVEAYLGDRWCIFDPSGTTIPMGLMRLGTGRDAADVAVATIFGPAQSGAPWIRTMAIEDNARGLVRPYRCAEVLSTDLHSALAA